MLRIEPPPKPEEFDDRMPAAVAPPAPGEKIDGPWSDFKPYLSRAQHGKCAYCECPVDVTSYGDVDHYRPKGRISVLPDDPDRWGRQVPNSAKVVGRKPQRVRETGYWWVAYSWENFLLSCPCCNGVWKKDIFPVKDARAEPCDTEPPETPLLLHPYRGPDPRQHLHYRPDGTVEPCPNSRYGLETIKTCGLHRPELTRYRFEKAREAFQLVKELIAAMRAGDERKIERKLRKFYDLGSPESPHFPGMVQAIFQQEIGVSWSELVEFVEGPAATA